jgi:hypothetical protein
MAEHKAADKGHDLHQRAKSETGRKSLAARNHHRRDPSGQGEDAQQAEEGGGPDRTGGPAVTRLQQFEAKE